MMIDLPPPVAEIAVPAPRVAQMGRDGAGRPTISAMINGKGPFDIVVDTAAQTTVLMPAAVSELGLQPLDGGMVVNGAVGSAQASFYPIDEFNTDLFKLDSVAMLALPNAATTRAKAIIGVDEFAQGKLVFDRSKTQVRFEASAPGAPGYVTVKGRVDDSGLLHVPLKVEGVEIEALVDSGAGETIANLATLKALGWADDDARLKAGGQIRGATLNMAAARIGEVALQVGPIRMQNVPMVFSDIGGDRPSIILGSNLLNLFLAYAVDFPRAELQIGTPKIAQP